MIGLVQRWLGRAGMLAGLVFGAVAAAHWEHPDAPPVVVVGAALAVTGWLMGRHGERRLGWRK